MSVTHALVFLFEVFFQPFIWTAVAAIVITIGLLILRMTARLMKS